MGGRGICEERRSQKGQRKKGEGERTVSAQEEGNFFVALGDGCPEEDLQSVVGSVSALPSPWSRQSAAVSRKMAGGQAYVRLTRIISSEKSATAEATRKQTVNRTPVVQHQTHRPSLEGSASRLGPWLPDAWRASESGHALRAEPASPARCQSGFL